MATGNATLKDKAVEELKKFWLIALYLTVFFAASTFYRRLVIAEFGVEGLVHKKTWGEIHHSFFEYGFNELVSRLLILVVSFIPFFAFIEIGEPIGWGKLTAIFFSRRDGAMHEPAA